MAPVFSSGRFQQFCDEYDIADQLATLYTPQQNDVSERKNKSIMEMTRCILYEKKMPKKLWAKVANTTICLLNRMLTSALHKRTLFKAWFEYKPDL